MTLHLSGVMSGVAHSWPLSIVALPKAVPNHMAHLATNMGFKCFWPCQSDAAIRQWRDTASNRRSHEQQTDPVHRRSFFFLLQAFKSTQGDLEQQVGRLQAANEQAAAGLASLAEQLEAKRICAVNAALLQQELSEAQAKLASSQRHNKVKCSYNACLVLVLGGSIPVSQAAACSENDLKS